MAAFTWGAGGEQLSTEELNSRRKLAQALMQQGSDYSPVQHWTQGLARVTQALMGGLQARELDEQDKAQRTAALDIVKSHPALQGAAPAAAPAAAPSAGFQRVVSELAKPTAGKIYSNDEPSPLDPPSGADKDMLVRTVLAEAGNQGPAGMQAVAGVARNRAVNGGFGGDTLPGVIQKPNQFEPWNTPQGQARMAAINPNSPQYAQATQAIDAVYAGQDPTMGATHFYAPKAQAALGRSAPAWDNGTGRDIGDHRFFGGAGAPPVTAGMSPSDISAQARPGMPAPTAATPPAAPQSNIPPAMREYINRALSNPKTAAYGQQLLQQYTKPSEPQYGVIGIDPATGKEQRGWIDPVTRTTTPVQMPDAQQPGRSTIPPPPPGVDPAIWNKVHSERATAEGMPASWDDSSKLRNEIQGLPSYKNLAQAAPVYRSMVDAAGRDNRAADVNLIYGMAKVMDPGSVVRESEMTVAQAVATLPQQLRATVESQMTGQGRLSPEVRAAIMQEAHSRVGAYQGMFDQDAGMYRGIAQRNRMNEADIIPNFGKFDPYQPAAPVNPLKQKYGLE